MSEKNTRDKFFVFYGIVIGAALGFFGSIGVDWYLEAFKDTWLWPTVGIVSLAIFLSVVLYSTYKLYQLREALDT